MHENDYLIKNQLIARGIKDARVLEAFKKVDRKHFTPSSYLKHSYSDSPLPLECEQTISQPYIVALMTEALKLKCSDTVLELGTGSGYQTALLAYLSAHVYTAERHEALLTKAKQTLTALNHTNISYHLGNGIEAFKPKTFDKIIVTAACETLPESLANRLNENGIMVVPVGKGIQELLRVKKTSTGLTKHVLCYCRFVPLIED